jgi:(R)-2-hydroxyacyl-CoA dehydratese activating ATPase
MEKHFLGVDIGSSFMKFIVIDSNNSILYKNVVRTLSRNKKEKAEIQKYIFENFNVAATCATGYGREHHDYADITKTEIYCASAGVSTLCSEEKTIIDVGGEDVKVIRSSSAGKVLDFYMNTKCAAGTGTFITEIAERAEIDVSIMSELAAKSKFSSELNSFCTVFAKTEIMKWLFNDVPVEDVAKGIYLSIINRISKIRMEKNLKIYLIGGVAQFHPYLKTIMEEKFNAEVVIPGNPQFMSALGAAALAKSFEDEVKKEKKVFNNV